MCTYCGKRRNSVALEDLADRIHHALQEHYELTPGYPTEPYEYFLESEDNWERRGDPVKYVIADIAVLGKEVARDVRSLLSSLHGDYRTIKHGGIDPYDLEAQYEERDVKDEYFHVDWHDFRNEVQSRVRFFSPNAEKILDRIFGDLTTLKSHDDKPVIRKFGPNEEERFVWRARTAYSIKELETILGWLTREIGPPPSKLTPGGRMNAQGIAVFYGALDAETCISEVRPPVGSYVAVAKFEFIRPVLLLDLDILADVRVKGSLFDSDFVVRLTRAAFLRYLVREISRPVMPQDEAIEYLPTQAVAEYLANKVAPRIDGIIFRSSQTGGNGRNLVLFNHACRVEQHTRPQEIVVSVYVPDFDEVHDNDVAVFVDSSCGALDKTSAVSMNVGSTGPIGLPDDGSIDRGYAGEEHEETGPYIEPSLRMDVDGITVHDIESVKHAYHTRAVNWYPETATTKPHLDPEELARLIEPRSPTP